MNVIIKIQSQILQKCKCSEWKWEWEYDFDTEAKPDRSFTVIRWADFTVHHEGDSE